MSQNKFSYRTVSVLATLPPATPGPHVGRMGPDRSPGNESLAVGRGQQSGLHRCSSSGVTVSAVLCRTAAHKVVPGRYKSVKSVLEKLLCASPQSGT